MSNASSITGYVIGTRRHGHTINGNPMMSAVINVTAIDGTPTESSTPVTVRISNDAGLVYGINNSEYRETLHTFELTASGRLSGRVHLA